MKGSAENRTTGANWRLAKKRVQGLNEALCFVSSPVLADQPRLMLRNHPFAKALKVSRNAKSDPTKIDKQKK